MPPNTVINVKIKLLNSNKGEHLITKNTPAVTKVAACINADTGVGPSIASGNQVCKPIWADLPTTPINKKKQIISKHKRLYPNSEILLLKKKGAIEKIIEKSVVLKE